MDRARSQVCVCSPPSVILPMCRDPVGPMSSDGELGLGPLPVVTAAYPEVTLVYVWNTVSLRQALQCFFSVPSKMWPCLDTQGETTRSRQEEEERVILRAWQNMVSTSAGMSWLTFDPQESRGLRSCSSIVAAMQFLELFSERHSSGRAGPLVIHPVPYFGKLGHFLNQGSCTRWILKH